jgi:predicted phage replisome organizer
LAEEVKWIKIYIDIISNTKIKRIRKMPEGNSIILIWVFMIVEAGKCNRNGGLYITDLIPFSVEDFAIEFDFEPDTIRLALTILEKYEMIHVFDDVIFIKNWEKYQNIDGMEKIREQTRMRVQNYRQKQLCNVTCNATVTDCNATELELEIDKEKDINNIPLKKESKVFSNKDNEYLLAEYLSKQISERLSKPLQTEKILQQWAYEFNKLIRLDKYDIDEIKKVLVFSQKNNFWQSNILSAGKFRKQYLVLLSQMRHDNYKKGGGNNGTNSNAIKFTVPKTEVDSGEDLNRTAEELGII